MHLGSAALGYLLPSSFTPSTQALVSAVAGRPGASPVGGFSQALRAARAASTGHASGRSGRALSGTDGVDAAARQAAHLAPPGSGLEVPLQQPSSAHMAPPAPPAAATGSPPPPPSLEEMLPALVRKIAWSGDARRGAVRIEFGSGALAGATLLVAVDGSRVKVTLSSEASVELAPWRERIIARLEARGLDVDVG